MSNTIPTGLEAFFRIQPLNNGVALPARKFVDFSGGASDDPAFQFAGQTVGRTLLTAPTPSALGNLASVVFGDGSDGNYTCDGVAAVPGMVLSGGNYTLIRDVYFNNLTVQNSPILFNAGWRIFVRSVLTVYGEVSARGGNGSTGVAGVSNTTTQPANFCTLGGGGPGGLSGAGHQNMSYSMGGVGGANGDNTYLGGTAPRPNFTQFSGFRSLDELTRCEIRQYSGGSVGTPQQLGGGGGGGGSRQAVDVGGGAGGGVLLVAAAALVGSGLIDADGGRGGDAAGDPAMGPGGGGGGLVVLLVGARTLWTGTVRAQGGPGGAGGVGTGGANGRPGNDGTVIFP